MVVLLAHLLKWRFQPDARSSSWLGTIRDQRDEIESILGDSPSLRPVIRELLARAHKRARQKASEGTQLPEEAFPIECPFTAKQILAEDFLPED